MKEDDERNYVFSPIDCCINDLVLYCAYTCALNLYAIASLQMVMSVSQSVTVTLSNITKKTFIINEIDIISNIDIMKLS